MKAIISYISFVWCLLSASFAAAQSGSIYGIEDETKPVNSAITMEQALSTMREFIAANQAIDFDYILALTTEPWKSRATQKFDTQGRDNIRARITPREKWQIHCAACWDDKHEGSICLIDMREYLSIKNNRWQYSYYILKNEAGMTFLSDEIHPKKKRGRKLKKRAKKNGWTCGIDK